MKKLAAPNLYLAILTILLLVLLSGLIISMKSLSRQQQEILTLHQQIEELTEANQELFAKQRTETVTLFFIKATPKRFYLKPQAITVKASSNKPLTMLEALLERVSLDSDSNSNSLPVFPEGTKVLGLEVKNGLATVNLNKKACELNVGAEGELLAVYSIVNTLTKLPEIAKVKFLVEGQEVESLAGHDVV